jgi:hypothetical protein
MRFLLTTLAVLAVAAPAQAARTVPRGFYGVTYDGEVRDASASVQSRTWGRMAASGAESARATFSWAEAQSVGGTQLDLSRSDRVVEDAAEHGVELLPVIVETPYWARRKDSHWWPQRPAELARFMRHLVERYGPDGSFWSEHPDVPKRPLRHWQIYNEPGFSKRYGPLLRAAYRAVKRADRGAKVVLAGLTSTEHATPWRVLRYQYREGGIKGFFDVAALHMYTQKPANVVEGARIFRRAMKAYGDGRTPLWLTEFGTTASRGRTDAPRSQRTLRTTDRGMARFLREAYRHLARARTRPDVRVRRAYWYTWASSYQRGAGIFRFAGLLRYDDGRFDAKPALAAYRDSARRDEGCAKTTTGRCR